MIFCDGLGGVVECESGEKVRSHSSAVSAAHQRGKADAKSSGPATRKGDQGQRSHDQ